MSSCENISSSMVVQHKGLVRKGNEKAYPEGWSWEAALYTWQCILLCKMKMKLRFNSYVGVSLYFSCPTHKLKADKAEQGQRQEIQTRKPHLFCSLDLEFRSISTLFFWAEIPRLSTRGRCAARKRAPRNSPGVGSRKKVAARQQQKATYQHGALKNHLQFFKYKQVLEMWLCSILGFSEDGMLTTVKQK